MFFLCRSKIVWENRKHGDQGNDCLVSVDGTDCRIPFQQASPESFYTYKHNGAGLRYEVALCILTGWIVWVMGPFPPGDWVDVECFRFALKQKLDRFEHVEADDGYIGEDPGKVKVPGSMVHDQDEKQLYVRGRVRRRQETVNLRIKFFTCMNTVFRHHISFHGTCFKACAVLVQLAIENGHPLFEAGEYLD